MDLPKLSKPKIGVNPVQFLKEVKAELKKVKWPTKKEVVKMTGIVLGVSVATGLFLSGLDLMFTKLFTFIIQK
ncbi:preprotein translocase subunit SecE [Candidatus Beckwithbacteria bacterium RBG_13_35_6]|uniref:Protein translocase subunit SecE n=1 Tax=Candidatus Beckwithbacteria bacterium RBG_13_35_6 TaxID=1797456 RepID=A0A1F5DEJ4_9BACT|nr:MAG: preprotein translocase subunit SecE [Candidatus Beckwithbacteria bacterium RBG_13_35_6]